MSGLYDSPLAGEFTYLCGGNGSDNDNESCLGLAPIEGGIGYAIQGNKAADEGRELRGTLSELQGLYKQLGAIPGIRA